MLADVVGDEGAERHHLEALVGGVAQRPVDDLARDALAFVAGEGFGVGEGDDPRLLDVVGDRHRLVVDVRLVARLLLVVDDLDLGAHSIQPLRRPWRRRAGRSGRRSSRIRSATSAIASTAAQASEPPTLIRRAPAPAISATDSVGRASTLTGLPTASTTAAISSAVASPGA